VTPNLVAIDANVSPVLTWYVTNPDVVAEVVGDGFGVGETVGETVGFGVGFGDAVADAVGFGVGFGVGETVGEVTTGTDPRKVKSSNTPLGVFSSDASTAVAGAVPATGILLAK
jgi:hypothetical protein